MNFLTATAMCLMYYVSVSLNAEENGQQSYFLFLGGDGGSAQVEKQIPKTWGSEFVINIMAVWSAAPPHSASWDPRGGHVWRGPWKRLTDTAALAWVPEPAPLRKPLRT